MSRTTMLAGARAASPLFGPWTTTASRKCPPACSLLLSAVAKSQSDLAWVVCALLAITGITMHTTSLLLLALLSAVVACNAAPPVTKKDAVLASLTTDVFVPLASDIATEASAFREACEALVDSPSADRLEEARVAYRRLRNRWKVAEVLSFGPHRLYPYRTESKVDFYPPRLEDVEAVLGGAQTLSTAEIDAVLGASARGLPAAEFLLFSDASLAAFENSRRRGAYLQGVAALLERDLKAFADAWRDDFRHELLAPEEYDRYDDGQEAFSEFVNNIAFTAELVRDRSLLTPLGEGTAEAALQNPERNCPRASVDDCLSGLSGLQMVWTGCDGERCGIGLRTLIAERRPALVDRFESYYGIAEQAVSEVAQPLCTADASEREQAESASLALRDLIILIQTELMQALNVSPTFGGNDGD